MKASSMNKVIINPPIDDAALELLTNDRPSYQRAVHWLVNAQYNRGSIRGLIPKKARAYGRIDTYPEITGYAATTLSRLYLKTGLKMYFDLATAAAEGLARFMQSHGGIPAVINKNAYYADTIYSFDQAIMAQGLWDFYRATIKHGNYDTAIAFQLARNATDFLKSRVQNGILADQYTLAGTVKDSFSYCILGKCALPFISFYQEINDEGYLNAAIELVKYSISSYQKADGSFTLSPGHHRNRVHYHCYAVEGILKVLEAYDDESLWSAAKRGGDFLAKYQNKNGGFRNYLPTSSDDGLEDIPPAAQAVVIWAKLYTKYGDSHYLDSIHKAMNYLEAIQFRSFLTNLDGAFPFLSPAGFWKEACPWATEFFIDIYLLDTPLNLKMSGTTPDI